MVWNIHAEECDYLEDSSVYDTYESNAYTPGSLDLAGIDGNSTLEVQAAKRVISVEALHLPLTTHHQRHREGKATAAFSKSDSVSGFCCTRRCGATPTERAQVSFRVLIVPGLCYSYTAM